MLLLLINVTNYKTCMNLIYIRRNGSGWDVPSVTARPSWAIYQSANPSLRAFIG